MSLRAKQSNLPTPVNHSVIASEAKQSESWVITMLTSIYHSKSKSFLSYCLFFLLGAATASLVEIQIPNVCFYTAIFVFITFLIIFWKSQITLFFLVCSICFVFGLFRYQIALPVGKNHIKQYANRTVEVIAVIDAEPDIRTDGIRYIAHISKTYAGNIYIKMPLYPRYGYGDELRLQCHIEIPEPIEEFRYDMYLARYGVFAICRQPFVIETVGQQGNIFLDALYRLKELVAGQITLLWHEPRASFMAGLLYGYRGGLGELNELFSLTGTTHIIAISGYNISIVSTILLTICLQLLIPRKKAFWLIVFGIGIFVIFAGLSASVVRAGIMGSFVLLATQVGSRSNILNVMVLTAAVMTLHNPFILIWDAGFQLSFLSTLGLVYVSPHIEPFFAFLPETFGLKESIVATLSATISTLPLILSQFGRLSVVALPVNILILWIIPFLMALGFFAVTVSFVFFPLGQAIAWVAWAGLQYIILIVSWFAEFSFAAVDITMPTWSMLAAYGFGIIFLYTKNKRII